ncbi:MAG: hypothetical protein QNK18_11065 [Gammaproteobacteria bacterium]|nr:hypothetical protein [Gammaproteobacteria bacterium]
MKNGAVILTMLTAALLAVSSASAQEYSYGYMAPHYGGVSTVTSPDGRGGFSTRTIIHGPTPRSVVITHPNGTLTTGTVDQFGNWYTITTPGNAPRYPRPLR